MFSSIEKVIVFIEIDDFISKNSWPSTEKAVDSLLKDLTYCKLHNINGQLFPEFSIEHAERMENCP